MAKGATFDNDFLKLILQAVNISLIADNTATTPITSIFVSLHTADPTSAGNQTSNEISYTGYARIGVVRSAVGWTVTGNSASPAADITFGTMTAGVGGTVTFVGLGTLVSGTGKLLWSGALSPTIVVSNGVAPIVKAGSTIVES